SAPTPVARSAGRPAPRAGRARGETRTRRRTPCRRLAGAKSAALPLVSHDPARLALAGVRGELPGNLAPYPNAFVTWVENKKPRPPRGRGFWFVRSAYCAFGAGAGAGGSSGLNMLAKLSTSRPEGLVVWW